MTPRPISSASPYLTNTGSSNAVGTQNRALSLLDMERCLNRWMHDGGPEEKRIEAKNAILDAYRTNSTTLSLHSYGLQTLPPEIGRLTSLQRLILANNELSSLPNTIKQLPQLISLNLGQNNFSSIPIDMTQHPKLKILLLYDNPLLSSLPNEISNTEHLDELDVSGCINLRHLPLGLEQLPSTTHINLERTGLSDHVFAVLSLAVASARRQSQGQRGPEIRFRYVSKDEEQAKPLAEEMLAWLQEANPETPINTSDLRGHLESNLLDQINPDATQAMATLLMRLRKTGQYKSFPKETAQRVAALLTSFMEQPSLLETFCAHALESTATCDDRTALGMLQMELALVENKALRAALSSAYPPRRTFKELFAVGQGVFRQRALMEIAHKHAQRAKGYVDETEIVLKYMTRLGKGLRLPVLWDHMLYEDCAFQVSDADLEKARDQLDDAATLDNPEFANFISQWPPFQEAFKQLKPQAFKQIQSGLEIIQEHVEGNQERVFAQYEQACETHGPESDAALDLLSKINENSAKIKTYSQTIWGRAFAWSLAKTETLIDLKTFTEMFREQNQLIATLTTQNEELIATRTAYDKELSTLKALTETQLNALRTSIKTIGEQHEAAVRTAKIQTDADNALLMNLSLSNMTKVAGRYLSAFTDVDAVRNKHGVLQVQLETRTPVKNPARASWENLSETLKRLHGEASSSSPNIYSAAYDFMPVIARFPRHISSRVSLMTAENRLRWLSLMRTEDLMSTELVSKQNRAECPPLPPPFTIAKDVDGQPRQLGSSVLKVERKSGAVGDFRAKMESITLPLYRLVKEDNSLSDSQVALRAFDRYLYEEHYKSTPENPSPGELMHRFVCASRESRQYAQGKRLNNKEEISELKPDALVGYLLENTNLLALAFMTRLADANYRQDALYDALNKKITPREPIASQPASNGKLTTMLQGKSEARRKQEGHQRVFDRLMMTLKVELDKDDGVQVLLNKIIEAPVPTPNQDPDQRETLGMLQKQAFALQNLAMLCVASGIAVVSQQGKGLRLVHLIAQGEAKLMEISRPAVSLAERVRVLKEYTQSFPAEIQAACGLEQAANP